MVNPTYIYTPVVGFLVGALVSTTGVGGGVMLLPTLIAGLRVPPIIAVGSDVLFMFFTKLWAVLLHWRRKNVDWQLAFALALGSLPGALAGIGLLALFRERWGDGVNSFLRGFIGVLLVVIPISTLVMDRIKSRLGESSTGSLPLGIRRYHHAVMIGMGGGFLVGLSSIGSGSVIIMLLFLFYRRSPALLVGTDIFHGMILSALLGAIHLRMGTVDFRLVGLLMAGSILGVMTGSRLTTVVPAVWLRRTILILLIPLGLKLL